MSGKQRVIYKITILRRDLVGLEFLVPTDL